jgi:transposase-like protein
VSYSPPALLPEGNELDRLLKEPGATFESVGSRYGVSRQAVHKRHKKWKDAQEVPTAEAEAQAS